MTYSVVTFTDDGQGTFTDHPSLDLAQTEAARCAALAVPGDHIEIHDSLGCLTVVFPSS